MSSSASSSLPAAVLVTGGCGFIGAHLVEALLERGVRVRVLDDLSSGKRSNLPAEAELVVGDVADPTVVRGAIAAAEGCFHLAAIASVGQSAQGWAGSSRVNLGGTVNVLDAARAARGGSSIPVVFASSAAVYGDAPTTPSREADEATPLSAYGADKRAGELHGAVGTRLHGVPCIGLRLFNVYGPRQDPSSAYSGVISRFAAAIPRASAVEIHGDGRQVRDFVYIDDVVDALICGMAKIRLLAPHVFNVCTGRATSIRSLAELMHQTAGADLRIDTLPARSADIRISLGDCSKARDLLGWRSSTPLEVGLGRTLSWYREHRTPEMATAPGPGVQRPGSRLAARR